MRVARPLATPLSLGLAAALLAACARPVDMSLASLHQRAPEFDFLLYQDGWACLSQGATEPAGSSCAAASGRQLRQLFAQRSNSRPLRDYLAANGASCRPGGNVISCAYAKPIEPLVLFGRPATSSREEGFELTVSFPARDVGLAPDQITTALRRYARPL